MDLKENARQAAEGAHIVIVDESTALRIGDIRDNNPPIGNVDSDMNRRGRIAIVGHNRAAALLAGMAGLAFASAGSAHDRAVDAGRRLADALTVKKFNKLVASKVGKRNAMSVATNRRAAAKKRRVKAHRARR